VSAGHRHAHGEGDPRAWAERALAELASRGHRAGAARAAVIERLAQDGGCLTAQELAERLRGGGRRVGQASVYRALGALEEAGLVRPADLGPGERRYELVHDDGSHHHHVVCERCGRTIAFSDAGIEGAIDAVARRLGVEVDAHEVVLRGTCRDCS
jgi:Fur family ferric uptake transcriptional regulator